MPHRRWKFLESLGCDPIEGMARIAMNEQHSPELRGRMYAELLAYMAPRRKAVEHSGGDGPNGKPHDHGSDDAAGEGISLHWKS
jgi:hypothetical protein